MAQIWSRVSFPSQTAACARFEVLAKASTSAASKVDMPRPFIL